MKHLRPLTNSNTSNTNPFLENLEPHDQLHTTTNVERSRRAASNSLGHNVPRHVEITVQLTGLLLQFGDIADILELGLGQIIVSSFATKPAKYIASFLFATNFDKPSRRLGEEPDNDEEEDQRKNLKSDGETPNKRTVATAGVGASTVFNQLW